MRYLSVTEIAKLWDVSERSVRNYCAHGRVNGTFLIGKTWNIPENSKKPERSNKAEKTTDYSVGYYAERKTKQMHRRNIS